MRRKGLFISSIFIVCILVCCFVFTKHTNRNNTSDSWDERYSFYEYLPPNQNMSYLITMCEKDGLYATIKIDGFHTLKRLKAKVWGNGDELLFEFYDYYVDENEKSTIYESYSEGDILLKLRKQDGVIITEWGKIQPMITENEVPGQYFVIETN